MAAKKKKRKKKRSAVQVREIAQKSHLAFWISCFFVLPFIFLDSTIEPVLLPRSLVLSGILLIGLVLAYFYSQQNAEWPDVSIWQRGAVLLIVGYAAFNALSLLSVTNLAEGLVELISIFLRIIFLMYCCYLMLRSAHAWLYLTRTITVAAFLLSFIGIMQYFDLGFTGLPGNFAVYSTMANKNQFASACVFMLPFLLYGTVHYRGYWSLGSMASLIATFYCICIANSLTSWIATGVLLAGSFLIYLVVHKRWDLTAEQLASYKKRSFLTANILAVVILAAVVSHYARTQQSQVLNKALTAAETAVPGSSFQERWSLWTKSVEMGIDHPIVGVGTGNWKISIQGYGTEGLRSEYGNVQFVRPHNDFLWALAEAGIGGFLSYLGFFLMLFYYGWGLLSRPNRTQHPFLVMLMLCGVLAYAVVSTASFPRERVVHSILFMAMAAAVISEYHRAFPISASKLPKITWPTSIIAGIICCMTMGHAAAARILAEGDIKLGYSHYRQNRLDDALRYLERVDSWWIQLDPSVTPVALYLGQAMLKLDRMEEAEKLLQEAVEVHPHHLIALNNLGIVYQKQSRYDEAIEMFGRALAISPFMESAVSNLASTYVLDGNLNLAEETINVIEPKYKINPAALARFAEVGIPNDIVNLLKPMQQVKFKPQAEFDVHLAEAIGSENARYYGHAIRDISCLNPRILKVKRVIEKEKSRVINGAD